MIKAAIFDVDGTLIDTVDLHAACGFEALRHYRIEASFEDLRLQIGKGGDQLLPRLIPADVVAKHGEEIQPNGKEGGVARSDSGAAKAC